MANPYPANVLDSAGNIRTAGSIYFTDSNNQPGGGSQAFVGFTIRHSADFTNISSSAPVLTPVGNSLNVSISLPPSLFGDASIIDVRVANDTGSSVGVGASLVVQSAAGTDWIERDTSSDQTVATSTIASINFAADAGSAGSGLSWNAATKQVDIASAGVYSAFVVLYAVPA